MSATTIIDHDTPESKQVTGISNVTANGVRERVLSCIQPTSEAHFGNWAGAISSWVAMQETHDCFFGIVDLHAMTMPYVREHLQANATNMVIDLLACGIDPEKSTVFIQSLMPEHTELSWILGCLCSFGELSRMTQFKEKSDQLKTQGSGVFVSLGLFAYPVLQAADILTYRAQVVPVGEDQVQHLELTRSIARRFNRTFGEFFPEPNILLTETPRVMSLADPDRKMSKSLGPRHFIGLFEEERNIRHKVMTAVTDSGVLPSGQIMSPGVTNLFEILRACGKTEEATVLLRAYESGERNYKKLKDATADALVELTSRFRGNRSGLSDVEKKIEQMSTRAKDIARDTLREVRSLVGLPRRD